MGSLNLSSPALAADNYINGLKSIEKKIYAFETGRISRLEFLNEVKYIAEFLQLEEFLTYIYKNKDPDPQLMLGLVWYYEDSLLSNNS